MGDHRVQKAEVRPYRPRLQEREIPGEEGTDVKVKNQHIVRATGLGMENAGSRYMETSFNNTKNKQK